jgi:ATP-binding cassette subfamily B protein
MSALAHEDDDRPQRLDLGLWRRLGVHAWPYRAELLGLVLTGLLAAAIDTTVPLLTAYLIDSVRADRASSALWTVGALYAGLLLLLATAIRVFIELAGRISTGVAHDLRKASFERLQSLSMAFYDTRPVGWLVARLTSDCGKVSGLLPWLLLDSVWGTTLVLGIGVAMLWLEPKLALVVFSIVPPLAIISAVFQRWMLESSREVRRTNARLTGAYNEAIMGVRTTKALAREPANLAEFQRLTQTMYSSTLRNSLQAAVYLPLVMGLGSVGVGLALWRAGAWPDALSRPSMGTLVAFMQYAALFSMPIQDMARQLTLLQGAQAAAERVQSLLETVPDIQSAPSAQLPSETRITSIRADRVGFSYKAGEPVLQDCTFEAHAGQIIALVGPTGGGKSTIVSLLARFYEVSEGSISINGIDLRELDLHWLQSRFGVVLQAPHLFSGTIAENIRYGRLEATDEEVQRAAARVCAAPFIEALPQRYDTPVGEGGSRLSTGQRQLVSMARAVLADPGVLVMDEATSSIDTETERAIQQGLLQLFSERISFVIAHRLSTIERADLILVIQEGRIVERGRHEVLMQQRGIYWQMQQADGQGT